MSQASPSNKRFVLVTVVPLHKSPEDGQVWACLFRPHAQARWSLPATTKPVQGVAPARLIERLEKEFECQFLIEAEHLESAEAFLKRDDIPEGLGGEQPSFVFPCTLGHAYYPGEHRWFRCAELPNAPDVGLWLKAIIADAEQIFLDGRAEAPVNAAA
ncbi:MAG TPA: hypothetical protein VMC43_02175 [Candidatus Paceibacterota bacterium]|nr:hypothetical protein [Candidatus Paceibacterota bacterium]